MKDIRLSIIVPGYGNPEPRWHRCIRSILKNMGPTDELICIDDASPQTPEFLLEYARKDSRVQILLEKTNRGASLTRKYGMSLAKGRYITFVDDDDELLEGTYDAALKSIAMEQADIAIFGVRSVWEAERLWKVNVAKKDCFLSTEMEKVVRLYKNSLLNYVWNKVYDHEFLKRNAIEFDPKGAQCEDMIFNISCLLAKPKMVTVEHVGMVYFRTHTSLLSCYKPNFREGAEICNAAWREYKQSNPNGLAFWGMLGEMSEGDLLHSEWDNLWRLRSPKSLRERFEFLKSHPALTRGHSPYYVFVMRVVYTVLRRWFYITPVQRWHIKRMYPDVKPL